MSKGRLEAYSDGVIAILITIMVLGLAAPRGGAPADLLPLIPTFLSYVLSFVFLGIYWNNHHHLFQIIKHVDGRVLWANLHLLFWLSLIPFGTNWLGATTFSTWPVAVYGAVLLLSGFAYRLLVSALLGVRSQDPALAAAVGSDYKGSVSLVIYLVAIPLAFFNSWLACALFVGVAAVWLVPDPRIERSLSR
jgi:uncharacterized membrane protein